MLEQYQPLFLKYRPQAISELVGQSSVSSTLANAIKYQRISHAYLFTGPRGTGKTSTARIFAKSLNCELGPNIEPCQRCTSCIEIKQGISPSVFEIDAASNNSVDDARLLIERAPLSAAGGRFKLYIIDECHMLTKEAFNALLKTIEEPPPNVIFILATTEEHKVLPTIVSRCQKLIFRLINEQSMTAHLADIAKKENISIEPEAITALARRANGGLRDALSLLDQISLLGMGGQAISADDMLLLTGALSEDILIAISSHIFRREAQQVLALLQELFISGREAHLIASELAKHMLNIAKAAHSNGDNDYIAGSEKYKQALAVQAKLIDQSELIQMIEEMDRLEVSCRRSAQPIMNLEIGLLSLCQRIDIAELHSIQSRLQKLESALTKAQPIKQSEPKVAHETKPVIENEVAHEPKLNNQTKSAESKVLELVTPELPQSTAEEGKIGTQAAKEIIEESSDNTEEEVEFAAPETVKKDNSIDIVWQNILTELQRRHLPTFSLVSTHAFPIDLSGNTLNIGVFVDSFQKMIESKIEHIKAAAIACNLSKEVNVRVRVEENGQRPAAVKKNAEQAQGIGNSPTNLTLPVNNQAQNSSPKLATIPEKESRTGQTAVKEAYRLFEGPGSRYIAPSG